MREGLTFRRRKYAIYLRGLRSLSWGRATCGYCGWGWRHQRHCPKKGWIR